VRIGTFTDGQSRQAAVEREGVWHRLGAAAGDERERILAALADPVAAVAAAEEPLAAGFVPAMAFRPARDVFCLGKNYRAHAEEFARYAGEDEALPPAPIVFTKSTAALCGPSDRLVVSPSLANGLDYEAELLVVIGQGGASISSEHSLEHVAGFSALNDFTARDLQSLHAQWYLGKSLPAATPWGPVIVTPDELEPFAERRIGSRVNGEQRQEARLGEMIFSVAAAIEAISRVVLLEPGDLIAMGTPSGVGVGFDPPRFLKDGDEVCCFIEGIGEITNRLCVGELAPEPVGAGG
jgi:2-keto-4-pentenoate hydratase/2-oxohepta-3-ene-1,7-dioic acid hydratase in catechol pathway